VIRIHSMLSSRHQAVGFPVCPDPHPRFHLSSSNPLMRISMLRGEQWATGGPALDDSFEIDLIHDPQGRQYAASHSPGDCRDRLTGVSSRVESARSPSTPAKREYMVPQDSRDARRGPSIRQRAIRLPLRALWVTGYESPNQRAQP
jgi:hypothetical protein